MQATALHAFTLQLLVFRMQRAVRMCAYCCTHAHCLLHTKYAIVYIKVYIVHISSTAIL